ncbi:MAG: competence protein ComEA [Armatimonadota bacterium]|nr:MAG: competence protein ComEA [Armatimonadota bacterium]
MDERSQRQKLAVLAIVALGALALVVGAWTRRDEVGEGPRIQIIEPDGGAPGGLDDFSVSASSEALRATPEEQAPSEVVVHVCGRVEKPGVYTLPPGARIKDAIKLAGGAKPDADLEAVNLAARAEDGQQIYLPKVGAVPAPAPPGRHDPAASRPRRAASAVRVPKSASAIGPVNINTAGPEELDRLPGVGPATAAKIIEYRRAIGGFTRPEDLLGVPGIGEKKFAQMKPYVVVR